MMSSKFVPLIASRFGYTCRNRSTAAVNHDTKPKKKITSVDSSEIEHLSKLSNVWWDENGRMCVLHQMNQIRIPFVRDGLANTGHKLVNPSFPLQGIKILDAGCGGGLLSEPLARIGAKVTGLDASSELISLAQYHASLDPDLSERLTYECTTVEEHAEKNNEVYDAIVSSEVVEHVTEKELFLKSCVKALKPGGSFFITTFNKTFLSWFAGIIVAEKMTNIIPSGTHTYDKFISPTGIQCLLETYACKTKLVHGTFYNPVTKKWSWSSSTAVHYALHAVKQEAQ